MRNLRERDLVEREKALRDMARKAGMNRREFIRLLGLGGSLAVFGASSSSVARLAWAQTTVDLTQYQKNFVKDTTVNFHHPFFTEAATHWWKIDTYITPWERLFIRSRYKTPIVDKMTWKLKLTGDAIERPMELTYDDLTKMRSLTAVRMHECFGNARTLFWEQEDLKVMGGNWGFGDVGQVEWHYVPISEILDRVRPKSNAVQALFWSGVDGPDTGRPVDLSELRARPEIIGIAYGLNGKDLPPDHGGPVRAIVPGWGGAGSVKWLTEIRIASHRFWTRMHTKEEAIIGDPAVPADKPGPNDEFTMGVAPTDVRGHTGMWQTHKSHLNIPLRLVKSPEIPPGYPLQRDEWPTLKAGPQTIMGYAYGLNGIQKVDYSVDGGATWHQATLIDPAREIAWVRFKFNWNPTPGDHTLMTRATDKKGNVQPKTFPFNELGIRNNMMPRFEVRVA